MTLAEYILSKLKEGWPQNLTNWDKSWCKIPTEKQLQKWITEFYELQQFLFTPFVTNITIPKKRPYRPYFARLKCIIVKGYYSL